jgi:hypothetical protein
MRYLITTLEAYAPALTAWFDLENNFNPDPVLGMVVYDLYLNKYTIDGKEWKDIQIDHL